MRPHLALLVDGDQVPTEGLAKLIAGLEQDWTVSERIVVRNWRSTKDQQEWRAFCDEHGLRCIQRDPVATGKNAADIELAVITVDLLHGGSDAFCLVTGDMDFTPVVQRIKRAGAHVQWVRPEDLDGYHRRSRGAKKAARSTGSGRSGRSTSVRASSRRPSKQAGAAPSKEAPSSTGPGAKKATKKAAKKATKTSAKKATKKAASSKGPVQTGDTAGLAREVRRIVSELQREGLHQRGWVSVNRVGNRLNKAGPWKERYDFPKRRPLHEALEAAGLRTEQTETGAYEVRV